MQVNSAQNIKYSIYIYTYIFFKQKKIDPQTKHYSINQNNFTLHMLALLKCLA